MTCEKGIYSRVTVKSQAVGAECAMEHEDVEL